MSRPAGADTKGPPNPREGVAFSDTADVALIDGGSQRGQVHNRLPVSILQITCSCDLTGFAFRHGSESA
jgi:hypothetical protein